MRLKKLLIFVFALILAFLPLSAFASENITGAKAPISADEAGLIWSHKFGESYKDAPSTVTVVDGTVVVMSRKSLYKLNAENGEIIGSAQMADIPNFGYNAPLCEGGIIYCPLDNGTVQAFDFQSLESLWIYKDELGGQSLSPIRYSDGCVFTGFWNDEDADANFVCIDNSGKEKWSFKHKGGFYWAGCAFDGDYVILGTDDGTVFDNEKALLLCMNKYSGELVDSVEIIGDQRSGIAIKNNAAYFVTKAGYLYKVMLEKGKFGEVKSLALGGASTSTPVIYGNALYVGVQGKGLNEGMLKSVDINELKVISNVKVNGYPQNSVMLCDAYINSNQIYIYSTYNSMPGGITVYSASPNGEILTKSELFVPDKELANYCISDIACDENGTLFYKNDSGCVFAVGKKKTENRFLKFINRIFDKIREILNKIFG